MTILKPRDQDPLYPRTVLKLQLPVHKFLRPMLVSTSSISTNPELGWETQRAVSGKFLSVSFSLLSYSTTSLKNFCQNFPASRHSNWDHTHWTHLYVVSGPYPDIISWGCARGVVRDGGGIKKIKLPESPTSHLAMYFHSKLWKFLLDSFYSIVQNRVQSDFWIN